MSTTIMRFDLFDVLDTPQPARTSETDAVNVLVETDAELTDVTLADDDPDRCCKGGGLRLWCKLCRQSPTYWQRAEAAP